MNEKQVVESLDRYRAARHRWAGGLGWSALRAVTMNEKNIREVVERRIARMALKEESTLLQCQECGKKFRKKLGPNSVYIECPKCGSVDIYPVEEFGEK